MKALVINLVKDISQSFTFYHEHNPFSRWHYHPEYELVLISKGTGKRMVGDSIDRFDEGDLVFLGSNLPHEWLCDDHYFTHATGFQGEGIVIQFAEDFLGERFFKLPENKRMRKVLDDSTKGCMLMGETKALITTSMKQMVAMNAEDKLYALFTIFRQLARTMEYQLLSSPNFMVSFQADYATSMKKVIEYIMQHFQEKIQLEKMLEIANMSSTAFSILFKRTYSMTFSNYVLKLRLGYACSLLTENTRSIAQISLDAGFDNLSNFNRLFKKDKAVTPKEFRKKAIESETFSAYYDQAHASVTTRSQLR